MRPKLLIAVIALTSCVALGSAGVASAGSLPPAVVDCHAHSRLTRHYTPSQLRVALAQMPPDITEYTDCYDVIQRQLLAELGTTKLSDTSDAGSGGSFLPTPVLVAIVVLAAAAASLGVVALRRRRP